MDRRALASSVLLSGVIFGVVVAVTGVLWDEPVLQASWSQPRADMDGDGLTDNQESVLGTRPDNVDTDFDGFSDLEELARGSDPRQALSIPVGNDLHMGMCASLDSGMVRVLSAAYVRGGSLQNFRLRIGIVLGGHAYSMSPGALHTSRGYTFGARAAGDRLGVVEFTFPESLLRRFGQLNLYSVGVSLDQSQPSVASVLPLVDMAGVSTVVQPYEFSSGGGSTGGVVYRPLGGNGQTPLNWSAGEVCWQRTALVGTDGAMLIQEIEAANCIPMDSYCSGSACSGSVGTVLQVPNPAALAGG